MVEWDSVHGITYKRLWCTHYLGFPCEGRSGRERDRGATVDGDEGVSESAGGCRRVKREGTSTLTYGAPYGRGVKMRRLRLRHRADGAQGVVQLGGGGNSVPGESAVFVITAASAVAAASAAAAATATAAISTAGVSTAVCTTGRAAASAATKLAQELVLVLDAPFTRPQLQHRPAKPEVEVRELEGHPRTSAKIDLNVAARSDSVPRLLQGLPESYAEFLWNLACF